jgi:hypothetical protein
MMMNPRALPHSATWIGENALLGGQGDTVSSSPLGLVPGNDRTLSGLPRDEVQLLRRNL